MGCSQSAEYVTYKDIKHMPDLSHLVSNTIKVNYTLYQKYNMPDVYDTLQEVRSNSITHVRTENDGVISHLGLAQNFPNLKILVLAHNGITSIEGLYKINAFSLQVLDLSQNYITSSLPLKKFTGMKNMVNLNLSTNFLSHQTFNNSIRYWNLCGDQLQSSEKKNQEFYLNLSQNKRIIFPQALCFLQESDQRQIPKRKVAYRSIKSHISMLSTGMIFKKVRFALNIVKPEARHKGNHLEGMLRRFSDENFEYTEQFGIIKVQSPTKRAVTF